MMERKAILVQDVPIYADYKYLSEYTENNLYICKVTVDTNVIAD